MAATFGRVAPTLNVANIERSIAFWTGGLGFDLIYTNGDPVCFAIVRRDAAEVHLKVRPEGVGVCHCHFLVEGLEDLYRTLEEGGVTIRQRPKQQPWGMRDRVLEDLDGNTMEIAERLA
jgi:catechol 2,3-dioxygenase-like lactoylglutathione lyase family enzyme